MNEKMNTAAIEKSSLEIGKWGNLLMAVAGVAAAYVSRSDALLVDGLYSGLNFFSAIIAARVSVAVALPADRRYPFGYAAFEALYVNFRALVLLGIMAYAMFEAVVKISTYIAGGEVAELIFGPIVVYTIAMVIICFGLSYWHRHNWQRTGENSELLKTESKASLVDGVISGAAGAGLVAANFLTGTSLGFLVPIADSIIVIVMTLAMVRDPILMFINSLREVAGHAAAPKTVENIRSRLQSELKGTPYSLLDIAVIKVGRQHLAMAFTRPDKPVSGIQADRLRETMEKACLEIVDNLTLELVIADIGPYQEDAVADESVPVPNATDEEQD